MSATTKRDLALTAYGDLDISGSDLQHTTGLQAVRQAVQIHLLFFMGEWFLNQEKGIPYYEQILVKNPNANILNSIFRKAILEVPGIKSLLELALTYDASSRTLSVAFTADTDFGEFDAVVPLTAA